MSKPHKITPDVYKLIEKIAAVLPPLQKISKEGKPLSRQLSKQIPGTEVPESRRAGIENFSVNKQYTVKYWEPVTINHSVNLRLQYQKSGMVGVEAYRQKVLSIVNKQTEQIHGKPTA